MRQENTTVGYLIDRGRQIRWRCLGCAEIGMVDLRAIASAKGEDYDLADRHPRCRLCPGLVVFADWSSQWATPLDRSLHGSPRWWSLHEQNRRAMKAGGWRIEMGKWVAPPGQSAGSVLTK